MCETGIKRRQFLKYMKYDKVLNKHLIKFRKSNTGVHTEKRRKHLNAHHSKVKREYTYNLVVVVGMQVQLGALYLRLQSYSLVTWPELFNQPVLRHK